MITPSGKLRVAIAGCGIGSRQARAFASLPGYEIVALCDTQLTRANALAGELGVTGVTANFTDLCKWDGIDIISICTPPMAHFAQITQALAGGKNVICEKPLVGSLGEIDQIGTLAEQVGRWVMPIFQLRFGSGVQKLLRLVEAGITGPLDFATVETAWLRRDDYYSTPWRRTWAGSLGGCLLGHGVHAHDLLTLICGPVRQAFGFAHTRVNAIETEDGAVGSLRLESGGLASIAVTLGSFPEISRLRFCFRHLTAESNVDPYSPSSDPWTFTGPRGETNNAVQSLLRDFHPEAEGYAGQFAQLEEALARNLPLPVTLADARQSIELATALYCSIATEQSVSFPIAVDHPYYFGWQHEMQQVKL